MDADGLSGRITCPPGLHPAPGQYLVAGGPDPYEPLPVTLFPSGTANGSPRDGDGLWVAGPLPVTWAAGMQLNLRGPLGNGFRLPHSARRVALASLEGSPARLLPLVRPALAQKAAVAVYARSVSGNLPAEVEVLPLDLLPEAQAWADFIGLESRLASLPALRDLLGLRPFQRPAALTQVLVLAPMPCSGLAECGACAVTTRDGWALTCTDGPVFDFNQLEGG